MEKDEESVSSVENHQAEDLSAKMARKSKPIPPPLNLSQVGDSEPSSSPLKDFAMLATSPRSPLVQKNLPFRKRAHSYSSTQTSSECDSPESPRILASPLTKDPPPPHSPSPCPLMKSPLASPTALYLNKKFIEPIKSLLPSPNTSASFFNNECDPIKSPMSFFRPTASDLLALPMIDKNSIKSPLTTPTRSVFMQNHLESNSFFTDMLKSPLNTPTRPPGLSSSNLPYDIFVMPEPISVKQEQQTEAADKGSENSEIMKIQREIKLRSEKENIAEIQCDTTIVKQEVNHENYSDRSPYTYNINDLGIKIEKDDNSTSSSFSQYDSPHLPLDCHKSSYVSELNMKRESSHSPDRTDNNNTDRSQPSASDLIIGSYIENNRLLETFAHTKISFAKSLFQHNLIYSNAAFAHPDAFTSASNNNNSSQHLQNYPELGYVRKGQGTTYNKPHTYNKCKTQGVMKRGGGDKSEEDGGKKTKKELNEERPRRPMNAFMLFAKHQRPLLIQQHPGKDNRAISVVLGTAWRELEASERADYVRRAAAMATEHKRRHPDCWKRRRVRVPITQTGSSNSNSAESSVAATS